MDERDASHGPVDEMGSTSMERLFRMVAASIAWFAIGLQYYLVTHKPDVAIIEATIRYFSYFTMLSNILVALAMTLPWLAPNSALAAFFSRPSVRTALATYIIIVAAIYHVILRPLWNPQGGQLVADMIEHVATPGLYMVDWLLFVPKGTIAAKSVLWWLIFPIAYAAYSLIHGAVTGYYPYPFLNVSELGYERVLVNMAALAATFAALGLVLVAIDRMLGAEEAPKTG
jgi:hypothetical protein